jgi:PAS domain S-box-containing protein
VADISNDNLSLRSVVDVLPRAIIVLDADGKVVLWNRAAQDLYGWTEEEVLGQEAVAFLSPPEQLDAHLARLQQAAEGESYSGDRLVRHKDGSTIRIAVDSRPVLDAAGELIAIVGASENTTTLRALEQETHELTEHLRLALDSAGLGTWRWDRTTGEVVWDERMEELFGFAPGTFDGTFDAYVNALHPDDRPATLATVDQAVETGEPYRVEHRVQLPDGEVRWIAGAGKPTVDEAGNVTGAIGCSADNTLVILQRVEQEVAANAARAAADQERIHRERLELLAGVNDALAHSNNRQEIMAGVARAVVPRLADWCSLHVLPDPTARVPEVETYHVDPELVAYAQGLTERFPYDPDAPTGVPRIIRTGQSEFYPDIDEGVLAAVDADDEARAIIDQLALRSAIGVPLVKRGRVVGALQLIMTESRRHYTADDLALAEAVASRVAASLENRRLAEEQQRIATTLQQSLLPDRLPTIPGMDVAVRYWAVGEGTTVGGDFYDLFPHTERSWAAVVGDVCGTGPTAAALTSLARHTIRQSAWRGDDPTTVLGWLNRAMLESTQDAFLTAAYLDVVHHEDGFSVDMGAAGHPLPVLVKADGSSRFVGEPGTLVGVFEKLKIHPVSFTLDPGDTLVLYTDGVSDVAPPHDLGDAEVLELITTCVRDSNDAPSTADRIHAALGDILPLEQREDDIALLVLRVDDAG